MTIKNPSGDDLLTIEDLAAMLHRSVACIYQWRHRGKAPKGMRPGGGSVLFRRSDVEAWLKTQEDEAV